MKLNRAKFEARAAAEFSKHGKEPMTAAAIAGAVYGFGSELATLRCAVAYKDALAIRTGYSAARESFYFAYDILCEFDE